MELAGEPLSEQLNRIVSLNGTDEGFFVLALHAFIEAYADAFSQDIQVCGKFYEKLNLLYCHLGWQNKKPKLLGLLCREHGVTNEVRHKFSKLSQEEALGAARNFLEFCNDVSLYDARLEVLREGLILWDEKKTPIERMQEMVKLRNKVRMYEKEHDTLYQAAAQSNTSQEEMRDLQTQLLKARQQNEVLQKRHESKKNKSDRLRKELHESKQIMKELSEKIQQLEISRAYRMYVQRYTAYTRTRGEYERSIIRMTPEQTRAAERIRETGDYLIRGPAGTGKTLVLLHALDQQLSLHDASLGFSDHERLVLLTYTNSLVRFNAYLSQILRKRTVEPSIETVDAFFIHILKHIDSSYTVDYRIISELLSEVEVSFFSDKELVSEIEDGIYGRNLDMQTYVFEPGGRTGLKGTLSRKQKEQVWEIAEHLRSQMLKMKQFSKNLSRLVLLEALSENSELAQKLSVRRLFVDEVQDLSPIETKLLGMLSAAGVVLAGDEQQAIYQAGFSFRKMGVNIIGRSILLSGNYRNTRQISMLAEIYRNISGIAPKSGNPYAFREGPSPELWQEPDEEALMEALKQRIQFFIDILEYDQENIAVLMPQNASVKQTAARLESYGYQTHDIRQSDFDFHDTPGIRVSTFHSAKGVEFPVVMLYIPKLPISTRISRETAEKACRNLVYMAMTRAMENLQVYLLCEPDQQAVSEIADAFQQYKCLEAENDQADLKKIKR